MTIIEQMKDDILNGEELQYDYEIDGVNVTVLADDFPWVRILAGGNEWETYVCNEHYDGKPLDCVLDEIADYVNKQYLTNEIKRVLGGAWSQKITVLKEDYTTTITFKNNPRQYDVGYDSTVSVTVNNQDLVDDEDGIITKVAEFFANY